MITVQNLTNGENFSGVEVSADADGERHCVVVHSDYPPLAIELLEHALVAMRARHEALQIVPAFRHAAGFVH